jgi:hypothetical protein
MSYKTAVLSSFEDYLDSGGDSSEECAAQSRDRDKRLARFPHFVMLQVAFPELDYANRWCWQQFGPSDGECTQRYSEYRVCALAEPHSHVGTWTWHWFVKTDYDFGFNEWYFAEQADRERFLANLAEINWGEHYPKKAQ